MKSPFNEFCDPSQPTLQEALDRVSQNGELPAARLPRVRAAVAAFSRLMRRPPLELPAHQGFIVHQMRRLRRQPTGLSSKTLSNTRSELLYLLEVACGRAPRSAFLLSEEWAGFRAEIGHSGAWWSLSRLAGFLSRQNVDPPDVTDEHLDRFRAALQQSGEVADPVGHSRRVIRVWNRLMNDYPTLRINVLTLTPQQRNRWTLPETAFAQGFRGDVDAWFQRSSADDPFWSGPPRALRRSTIRTRRHQLFKAASALVFSGRPTEAVQSLRDIVAPDAFQALLRHLLERQDGKRTEALHGLAAGLLAVARHHVGVDPDTEAKLARIVKNLDVRTSGFRSKTRKRLAAFEDDSRVAALLHLPAGLLAEAKTTRSGRRRKQLAQLAIAIEILTFAPMRITNLVSLRLGVNLHRVTLGRERRWLISIPAGEVKNHSDLSYELPSDVLVEQALALYEQPNGQIFPGRGAGPKAQSLLSAQIKRMVEIRLGLAFHTHMFRALAGYLHLKENPNGFEAVRALLGNRDDTVIRNNYAFLAERSLITHAQASIGRTRARLAIPHPKNKRNTA